MGCACLALNDLEDLLYANPEECRTTARGLASALVEGVATSSASTVQTRAAPPASGSPR